MNSAAVAASALSSSAIVHYGNGGTVVDWLNLESKQEVDELYHRWREAGAKILAEPEDKPWHLREFRVADLDGNQLRVFYDFTWELQRESWETRWTSRRRRLA